MSGLFGSVGLFLTWLAAAIVLLGLPPVLSVISRWPGFVRSHPRLAVVPLLVSLAAAASFFYAARHADPSILEPQVSAIKKTVKACPGVRLEPTHQALSQMGRQIDPCITRLIAGALVSDPRLEHQARNAVWWDCGSLLAFYVFVVVAALPLRSHVRYRGASNLVMGMGALAVALGFAENIFAVRVLSLDVEQRLMGSLATATSYLWHAKVALGAGASIAAVGATIAAVGGPLLAMHRDRRRASGAGTEQGHDENRVVIPEDPEPAKLPGVSRVVFDPRGWKRLTRWWGAWRTRRQGKPDVAPLNPDRVSVPAPDAARGSAGVLGICCSGGGIRSAAYNLGALQALREEGELPRARYLAAVSGGAYIASAMTIVRDESKGADFQRQPPFSRGSPEEQYLKNHTTYLAPGTRGALLLLWRFLRGFVINVALLALLLFVLGRPIGWLVRTMQSPGGIPPGSTMSVVADANVRVGSGAKLQIVDKGLSVLAVSPNESLTVSRPTRLVLAHSTEPLRVLTDDLQKVTTGSTERSAGVSFTVSDPSRATLRPGSTVTVSPQDFTLADGSTFSSRATATVVLGQGASTTIPQSSVVTIDAPSRLSSKPEPVATLPPVVAYLSRLCGANPCVDTRLPNTLLAISLGVLGLGLVVGLIDLVLRPRDKVARSFELWSLCLVQASLLVLVVAGGLPKVVEFFRDRPGSITSGWLPSISLGGVGSIVLAVVVDMLGARSKPAPANPVEGAQKALMTLWGRLGPRLRSLLLAVVATVVGPLALLSAAVFIIVRGAENGLTVREVFFFTGAAVALSLLWSVGDLNRWSMHPYYKRRLATAYALQRIKADPQQQGPADLAVPIDPDKRILFSGLSAASPELVVCAAANLSDPGISPPGRSVTSFTFSRSGCGGPLIGMLSAKQVEDAGESAQQRDVTVPAAVAMSGAAVSPSMGKMTKRPYRFLMAVANVRLGVWMPNPLQVTAYEERQKAKRQARAAKGRPVEDAVLPYPFVARPDYLLCELLGFNSLRRRFIYVTDGGHYENLGLVELLRRGCTQIYCFDASGDHVDTFRTLGDAVALARSLGVTIDIDPTPMKPGDGGVVAKDHVVGTIRYKQGEPGKQEGPGVLVFAKAAVCKDAPWDVRNYQEKDPRFPTHSTFDQLYTDEKFEAYRALGFHTAGHAIATMRKELVPPPPPAPDPDVGPVARIKALLSRPPGNSGPAGNQANTAV